MELWHVCPTRCLSRPSETCARLGRARGAGLRLALGAGKIPARLAYGGTLFSHRLRAEHYAQAMVRYGGGASAYRGPQARRTGTAALNAVNRPRNPPRTAACPATPVSGAITCRAGRGCCPDAGDLAADSS